MPLVIRRRRRHPKRLSLLDAGLQTRTTSRHHRSRLAVRAPDRCSLTYTNRDASARLGVDHRCCSASKIHQRPERQRDTAGSCKIRNSPSRHCQSRNARTKGHFALGRPVLKRVWPRLRRQPQEAVSPVISICMLMDNCDYRDWFEEIRSTRLR